MTRDEYNRQSAHLKRTADAIRARLIAAIDDADYDEARRELDAIEANANEQAALFQAATGGYK